MYWGESQDRHNELVANAMRRNRFEEIFQNVHFADNNLDLNAKFAKLLPLIEFLNRKFMLDCPVQECYFFDESMCEYFGHHGCKIFMKEKLVRFGF